MYNLEIILFHTIHSKTVHLHIFGNVFFVQTKIFLIKEQ